MSLEKRAVPSSAPFAFSDEMENLRERIQALERADRGAAKRRTDSVVLQRHHWFPWITLVVLLNFFLWFSMVHIVFEADAYGSHRARYLTVNWLIVFVPLLVTVVLLITPVPHFLKSTRASIAARTPSGRTLSVLNILNALACFTFVVVVSFSLPRQVRPPKTGVLVSQSET